MQKEQTKYFFCGVVGGKRFTRLETDDMTTITIEDNKLSYEELRAVVDYALEKLNEMKGCD